MYRIQISTENIDYIPHFLSSFQKLVWVFFSFLSCMFTTLPQGCTCSIGAAENPEGWLRASLLSILGILEVGRCPVNPQPTLGHPQGVGAPPSAGVPSSPGGRCLWRCLIFSLCLRSSVSGIVLDLRAWHQGRLGKPSRSPVRHRGLTSIEAALSGEAGLWPGARTKGLVLVFRADLCGCFSLLGYIFLLTKMISSPFPLVGLILSLVIIKC